MKVDLVNQNLSVKTTELKNSAKSKQSFTGISKEEKEVMSYLANQKAILKMKKLEWLKGEIGGILLTALGTGVVAPIPIAFNPFVKSKKDATPQEKEDLKNTKKYTAMRQPISAALAILFQASVQKYIDRFLDSIFNNPNRSQNFRENLDQSFYNTETYVKDNVVKDLKKKGIKKPSIITSLFGKKKIRDGEKLSLRDQYDLMVSDMVDTIRSNRIKEIAKQFEADNKIYVDGVINNDKSVSLGKKRALDNKTVAKLINEQIENYQKDANKLIKTEKQINDYVYKKAETFIENEDKLRKMFSNIPFEEAKNTYDPVRLKELYGQTTQIVKDLLKNEKDPKIIDILEDILSKEEDMRISRIHRTLKRIDKIKEMCQSKGGYTSQTYLEALIARNNVLHEKNVKLEACKIKDINKADEKTIKAVINKIAHVCAFDDAEGITKSVLRDTDTFDCITNIKALKTKIYKDVVNGYKEVVKNNYKSWNQVSKILVGVCITLPITCTALNWLYPRFMELFFPKLAGAKKAKQQEQYAQYNKQTQQVGGGK